MIQLRVLTNCTVCTDEVTGIPHVLGTSTTTGFAIPSDVQISSYITAYRKLFMATMCDYSGMFLNVFDGEGSVFFHTTCMSRADLTTSAWVTSPVSYTD